MKHLQTSLALNEAPGIFRSHGVQAILIERDESPVSHGPTAPHQGTLSVDIPKKCPIVLPELRVKALHNGLCLSHSTKVSCVIEQIQLKLSTVTLGHEAITGTASFK
jgi:hypothetical protein